jgi:hypothetical protein
MALRNGPSRLAGSELAPSLLIFVFCSPILCLCPLLLPSASPWSPVKVARLSCPPPSGLCRSRPLPSSARFAKSIASTDRRRSSSAPPPSG